MPVIKKDQLELYRRVEALEAALTVTLASISTALPSVKTDVVKNLRIWAENNTQSEGAPKALAALADKIEKTNFNIEN